MIIIKSSIHRQQKHTQGALQFPEGRVVGHVLEWEKTAGRLAQV